VNVGSLSSSQMTYQKPVLARHTSDFVVPYDNEERRMEHTSFRGNQLLNDFWETTKKMPREDQVSLAASVWTSQVLQNGLNGECKNFYESAKSRFSSEDLNSFKQQVKSHPLLKTRNKDVLDGFLKRIDSLWSQEEQESLSEEPRFKETSPALSPADIFFRTSLINNKSKGTAGLI